MLQCIPLYIALCIHLHLQMFMVTFEVSGFFVTINTGFSPGPLLIILLLSCVVETLQI